MKRRCTLVLLAGLLIGLGGCPDPEPPDIPYTPPRSVCGNDRQQSGETCDGPDLDGMTCGQLGYGAGSLACKPDCEDFDRAACGAPSTCGNGSTDGVEICDDSDLGGRICEDLGRGPGTLGCLANCGDYDTSGCALPPDCGDDEINGDAELCDGVDLDNLTCERLGFEGGELRCAADCLSLDRSGCQRADAGVPDTAGSDSAVPDGGATDTWTPDQIPPDAAVVDAAGTDQGAGTDAGVGSDAAAGDGATGSDAGALSASQQIQAVRDAIDGSVALLVEGVAVTYVKPAVGNEPAGYYVQAEQSGPALFVEDDSNAPAVGDRVSFRVLEKYARSGQAVAVTIDSYSWLPGEVNVETLRQDLSSAGDLVSAVDSYDNELIHLVATVTGGFVYGGPGHSAFPLQSAGIAADAGLTLRMPDAIRENLGTELLAGCSVEVDGVLDPFVTLDATQAQASIWRTADISVSDCAYPPELLGAHVVDSTSLVLRFDSEISVSSVSSGGGQFTISSGLSVTSATVDGPRVLLSLGTTISAGMSYTVFVASSVENSWGLGVSSTANSAAFMLQTVQLLINEVDYYQPGDNIKEFIEIKNVGASTVNMAHAGLILVYVNGHDQTVYGQMDLGNLGSLSPGGYGVVAGQLLPVEPGPTLRFPLQQDNLQNGGTAEVPGADGIALYNPYSRTVMDAISYEGSITAAQIDGQTLDLVSGTATSAYDGSVGSICRYPDGQDSQDDSSDWSYCMTKTPGTSNIY